MDKAQKPLLQTTLSSLHFIQHRQINYRHPTAAPRSVVFFLSGIRTSHETTEEWGIRESEWPSSYYHVTRHTRTFLPPAVFEPLASERPHEL
jgi:hypothetical protein